MRSIALFVLTFVPILVAAQSDPVSRSWNQPVEPFRIAGNLYYVGASDITSFLLVTPEGHILIDGGFVETVPQIRANVEKLGFRLNDVRILLSSHAHYDHAGGLAELRRLTGARFLASGRDIPLLARGGLDDPQFGDQYPFPPVYADGIVQNGRPISLGGTTITPHITPGHTPGCTTWTTRILDANRKLDVIFLCSMSVPGGYRLIGNPRYPDAIRDYRSTFDFLRARKPDIPLASHGNFIDLQKKIEALKSGARQNPFIDPAGYERLIAAFEQRFESIAAKQAAEADRRSGIDRSSVSKVSASPARCGSDLYAVPCAVANNLQ